MVARSRKPCSRSAPPGRPACGGPRTPADICADLERFDPHLCGILTAHIRNPANRLQTQRILRHLIIEQALTAASAAATASVFWWIAGEWPFRPAYELFRAFAAEFGHGATLVPAKGDHARRRGAEFRALVEPRLTRLLPETLRDCPLTPGRAPQKRSRLPAIEEEDA